MAGVNRHTLQPMANFPHALQSVEVIFITRLFSRVMRRGFGGGLAELLGRLMTAGLMGLFKQLLATSIDLWEPRFRVRRVSFRGSADEVRLGRAGVSVEVDWRPNALLDDFTVHGTRLFTIMAQDTVTVAAA
ncbi:MAG: GPW/gp25 family protein [Pseudomonadota bacterium]